VLLTMNLKRDENKSIKFVRLSWWQSLQMG
jgi:hypothetical protein